MSGDERVGAAFRALRASGVLSELRCTGIWHTPEGNFSSPPFMKMATLTVYNAGLTVEIDTAGAAAPNYHGAMAWDDLAAILAVVQKRKTLLHITFRPVTDGIAASFKARHDRIGQTVEALHKAAPPGLIEAHKAF